jgi:hypothetical protein
VKLDASASVLDWWAPSNWQSLDSGDADLGSSMPALLPGGYLFESGKDGNGYLLNGAALGHVSPPVATASHFCSGGSFGGAVYDPANVTIYAACSGGLHALLFGSGPPPSLTPRPGFSAPSAATGPPMIAAGLAWVASRSGTLYGLDLTTGATRSQFSIPEAGSQVNHFASPSAGGGRLFVASGDQVTAFTIAQPPGPSPTSTSLATSPSRVAVGGAVTLTATVSPTPGGGTVSFSDGGASVSGCGAVAVSSATGTASCQASFARAGAHPLIAAYAGDAYDSPSTSATVTETVTSTAAGKRPVLSHVSLSPRRLRPGQRPILRFTLNEPARLTVAITRGHQTLQRLRLRAQAGHHATKLRFRRLAPGRYTATVSATAGAGRRSRAIRLRFSVVRRHG